MLFSLDYKYLFYLLIIISACHQQEFSSSLRTEQKINVGWNFHLGDLNNTEDPNFDDANWRLLDLPHDFSIEQGFDENYEGGWRAGYTKGGIGWYRKDLTWQSSWEGKKVYIQFDGIYMNSDVWINGHHLGHRPYGYISFIYDLTPYLNKEKNILAVRVDNKKIPSGRWYTGSGIYRHVWLKVTNPLHVDHWGTYVTTPEVSSKNATVSAEIKLVNDFEQTHEVEIENIIKDQSGNEVTRASGTIQVPGKANRSVNHQFEITDPDLWNPDNPNMYQLESIVKRNNTIIDRKITPFGIRRIQVSAEKGFQLNGESIKIRGVCNHHDGGPVGAAVPDDVLYHRLKMLKEMGANAVRTAHNPASPELYAICDTLGLMVMDEAFDGWEEPKAEYDYGLYFEEWWQQDLEDFLLRDRNHPSIIMWSIGNEVRGFTEETQKKLVDIVHQYDTTRPITQARGYKGPYIDVAGFNGHGEEIGYLEEFHAEHPDKPAIGTEMTHTLQTRGIYQTRTKYRKRDFPAIWELGSKWEPFESKVHKIPDLSEEEVFDSIPYAYQSSYDNAIVRMGVRDLEKMTRRLDFFMGSFRWTGFDYLGEATIQPARTANFGVIDLAGFPKDHYFLYQSLWSDDPMVHVIPHWTHPGKEGVEIPVVVYTNLGHAELFLNGKSLGKKKMTEDLQIVWQVPYQPGELKVIAGSKSGENVVKTIQTAGEAAAIQLKPDKTWFRANKQDVIRVEINVIDDEGIVLPEADHLVKFDIEGPAKNIGVENGDILDFDPVKADQRRAFKGKCLLLLQSTDQEGEITVNASSEGLKTAVLQLKSIMNQ